MEAITRNETLAAIKSHIVDKGQLTGNYGREE